MRRGYCQTTLSPLRGKPRYRAEPGIDLHSTQEQHGLWESTVAPVWGRPVFPGRLRPKARDPDMSSAKPMLAYLAAAAPEERRALRPGTAGAEAGCGRTRAGSS